MQETLRLLLTNFTDETIMISLMILIIVFCSLVFYWLYNRRKYRELTHQIPASVVKNYLDSIIQNSTSLKSQLFRGGGLELGDGIPSVFPTKDFPKTGVEVATSSEEISQKNAEIASLTARLADKDTIIADLEKRLTEAKSNIGSGDDGTADILRGELEAAQERIVELEAEIASLREQLANAGSGGDGASSEELEAITQERDELKQRLAEYEVLEDDIADLKKFKQENEQLKKSLAAYEGGGAAPVEEEPAPEPEVEIEPEPEPEPEPVAEEPAAEEEPVDDLEAQMAAAIENPDPTPEPPAAKEEKEDGDANQELISEFEKMLG